MVENFECFKILFVDNFGFKYDCNEGTADPDNADKLGQIEVSLAEVVQGRLRHGKKLQQCPVREAVIYVTARETVDCRVRGLSEF